MIDTILTAAALTILVLLVYYAYIQREQRILLTAQIDVLEAHLAMAQKSADTIHKTITAHLAAKGVLLDECDALERQNNFLMNKRAVRNSEVMRHNLMPHQRGH